MGNSLNRNILILYSGNNLAWHSLTVKIKLRYDQTHIVIQLKWDCECQETNYSLLVWKSADKWSPFIWAETLPCPNINLIYIPPFKCCLLPTVLIKTLHKTGDADSLGNLAGIQRLSRGPGFSLYISQDIKGNSGHHRLHCGLPSAGANQCSNGTLSTQSQHADCVCVLRGAGGSQQDNLCDHWVPFSVACQQSITI